MIYATAKPIEEYTVVLESGMQFGLYDSYYINPDLLALIMLFTVAGYDYESDKINPPDRIVELKNIEPYEKTLDEVINGTKVRELLRRFNPLEVYDILSATYDEHLSTLTVVKEVYNGNPDLLVQVVGARAAVWASHYRGVTKSKGKVITAVFSKGISVPAKLKAWNEELQETIYAIRQA